LTGPDRDAARSTLSAPSVTEPQHDANGNGTKSANGKGKWSVHARTDQAKGWLERARKRSTFVDVLMLIRERDQEAAGTVAGSAVAFRLFLFFVPMLLVVVAIAGFVAAQVSAADISSEAGISGV